jgi:hypothetical protein
MPRIYACLAIAELLVLILAGIVGITRWGSTPDRHVLFAVLGLLLSCLVQVVAFTYLTVLEKMSGQAAHLGKLGVEPLLAIKRLKSILTRWLGVLVLVLILVTATGAHRWRSGEWATLHFASAFVVLSTHVLVHARQYLLICEASKIAEATLRRYAAIREARQGK